MENYSLNKRLLGFIAVLLMLHNGFAMKQYYYEEIAKKVNEIFLSTIAKGITDFTEIQVSELYDIANQCPLAGGEAVYRARAMYSLINPEAYYLDKELCIQSGNNWRKGETITTHENFQLYPNPTAHTITCTYSVKEGNSCILYIHNTLGQLLQKTDITSDTNIHTIDVSKHTSGVYYYKLIENKTEKYTGKLIIIK